MSGSQGSVRRYLPFIFITAIALSKGAQAAPDLSPADRDTLQQQQRDLLEQNRQQRQELQRTLTPELPSPRETAAPSAGPCFTINAIRLEGADHLPVSAQRQLTQPYLRQCLTLGQIQTLVQKISDWYITHGYITSRAFLTEQNLSQGELRLLVLEGRLERIQLEQRDDRMLKMAFPGLPGQLLNLRDIEQGMEQINRLRRQPVQIEILPGSRPGYSVVNLSAKPAFPLTLGLGFDNSGQKRTGTGQVNGSLTGNNLLGLADQWFVAGARSSDFANDHNARSVQAGVSLPYGYWTLDYNYAYSDYLATLENRGFDWRSSGDSQTHRLGLSRVLYRDGQMKTGLSLGLTHRINRNDLNDTRLTSSSRKLTSLTLGVSHGQKLGGGFATFNPAYSRGVPWLGAENDSGKIKEAPRAEFHKVSLSGSYYLPLAQDWTYLTSLYGQWTPGRLYGSERLTLGGESSVRGFKEQYLSGDKGAYWRNEVNRTLVTLPVLGSITALAALDGGWLHRDRQDINASGTLWGAAVGLGSRNRYVGSQLTVGWPLAYPDALKPDRVSVYYRINLVL
ncbi:ShlB/FhaC/HecB family hemolysin secretion/activation protein [Serratia sp. PF2-63]|uniref:ShlB/FhaC/HecB family hemolysin secretion/activation protein n=1 Tax=unclassified Serratia (in: enterobacteria) TaxID=2647522 RepID=UPI0024B5CC8E|nr:MULTISPECIES: ShlB/FhaC/HecB family hemolysin secretion/activation protein [unclassified Serratia (in: enterobacteria)]MDI9224365.1 ShlB/FhaC/HecB family hemolysin secretion/activation protein [Serratia bockelmannii]MDI9266088.1 ShlB/FhaC/HecB family hemolysin secretion/activation protein [Serratia sp. PF2-63]MDI9266455.1 ShlB/FhaC/HecB family hemolysin secretion/activation protein [Serratia sp. PF-27]